MAGFGATGESLPLSGIVLAGGRSRRMGREKAELVVAGKPLLTAAIDVLAEVADEIFVSCRRDAQPDARLYQGRGVRLVFDERAEGPLAGLEAGLSAATYPAALVIPVDMPRLTVGLLARLVAGAQAEPDAQAVVYVVDGQALPLPALYRRTALPALSSQLDLGDLRFRDLLGKLEVVCIAPDRVDLALDAFSNVNAPGDLAGQG